MVGAMPAALPKFDLPLFLELNEAYRSKPLVPKPPSYSPADLTDRSKKKVSGIRKAIGFKPRRILEIGCGRAETSAALAEHFGCEVVGVDITQRAEWTTYGSNITCMVADLSAKDAPDIGRFDLIYSNSVWEHLRHPYAMLKKARDLLEPEGKFVLSANLYRGPKASHRYREVFFPWPHLLFTNDVFLEFYKHIGVRSGGKAWVNQLSIADYLRYFELLNFNVENLRFSTTPLDEAFYERFEDVLGQFPRYDLERDFIHVTLSRARS